MKRRDFLRSTGWFVVGASLVGAAPACDDGFEYDGPGTEPAPRPMGSYAFPQGVASGDPRESSVILWTRLALVGKSDAFSTVRLKVQVSTDASFGTLVVD